MNSPEIEFDKNVRNIDLSGYDVRIVGKVNFINTTGKYNVIAESPLFLNTSNVRVGIADTMTRSANLANGFYDRRTCYWLGEHGRYYRQGRVMSAYAGWVDDICNIFSYDGKVLCGWNDKSAQNLYMMYPWQRQHLNNYNGNQYVTYGTPSNPDPKCGITDEYESSKILKKVLANLRYCETSYDNNNTTSVNLDFLKLFDSDESMILILNSQQDVYQGNVDQIINCTSDYESARFSYADGDDDSDMHWDIGSKTGYPIVIGSRKYSKSVTGSGFYDNIDDINDGHHMRPMNATVSSYRDFSPSDNSRDPILMRYKSTPHMVFGTPSALTEDSIVEDHPGYLYLGEVYKSSTGSTLFDDTDFALQERTWVPCGPEEQLSHTNDNPILWLEGDTYFQRYDCLKTYPFSNDDYQSVVEIASFMVETHVNLDGRYDQNRGLIDNTYVNPTNFNLINDVYSQDNNFFRYNILDKDRFKVDTFPTRVTWSLNKINNQDIDEWTRTNTAAFMDLDGDKGGVSSLRRFNNQIYAFQQSGISRIKYNENVAIPTNTGTPIELGNSQSVNGKEYISETVGSQNKWSCISTPNGIFFVDNNTPGIYRLGYGQNGISLNNITKDVLQRWFETNNKNGFVNTASYDANMEEVLFTYGDASEESLAYSNRYGFFSSFYDYQGWIDNIGKHSFNIYDNKIWFLREGDTYNVFYKNGNGDDIIKPYWTSFVASPMFQGVPSDCIFDNVWYRADVLNYSQDETNINYKEYIETMDQKIPDYSINDGSGWYETFDKIEAGNDYQYAISTDKQKFIKKFRMWRVPVPRNQRGQLNAHRDRMRNSWLRFKLENTNPSADKMVLRDVYVDSFF